LLRAADSSASFCNHLREDVSNVTEKKHGSSYTGNQKGAVMRFSAAIASKQPLRNAAATHSNFIRRVVGAHQLAPQPKPEPPREQVQDDLPADLDERVRLSGEW
jgi:hypothetical protein